MARTAQTAKKSNGGIAPRTSLAELRKLGAKAHPKALVRAHLEVCPPHVPVQHHFCMLCRDGVDESNRMYACDECPRVVCTRCMDVPSDYQTELEQPDINFRCLHCHTLAGLRKNSEATPYYGFFRDGKHFLPSFLHIRGQLEVSRRSEISAASVLIIHFTLVNHVVTGCPIKAMYGFLAPYFPHGGLHMVEVIIDLSTKQKIGDYHKVYTKIANDIVEKGFQRICIAITTHTDDQRGDLFLGQRGRTGSYIAVSVRESMDVLLSPWQDIIRCAQETTLFFLCCGAIVNQHEAFADLRSSILSHGLSSAVAFTAAHFQPSFICHLITAYAELVIIERFALREAFPEILGQSYRMGMHTDVILLTTSEVNGVATLQCTRYAWAHTSARPWGFDIPMQCPQCGCINEWKHTHDSGKHIIECTYKHCGRSQGKEHSRTTPKKYTFKRPKGAKLLKPGRRHNASWLEVPLDSDVSGDASK